MLVFPNSEDFLNDHTADAAILRISVQMHSKTSPYVINRK